MRIENRVVVVTGASRGIGRAASQALCRAGAQAALLARSREVEDVAAEIAAAGGHARAYRVDVTDAGAVEEVSRRITVDLGAPTIIVNNAGSGRWLYVEETPPQEMVEMMASPYFAAFYVTRAFLPAMLARADGCVVNVNSPAAWIPWPGSAGYTAARSALRGLTAALRIDLRGTGVRVMEIVPGKVASSYFESNPGTEQRMPRVARLIPTLSPAEVATALVRGVERNRRLVVTPTMLRIILALHALSPSAIDWALFHMGWRRAVDAQEK